MLAGVLLIAIGTGFGLLPYALSLSANADRWLAYGNGLAGGIFIGAGLLHLLPDADRTLTRLQGMPEYPVAFLLAGIGFMLVLLLEQVLVGGQEEDEVLARKPFPVVLFLVLSIHSFIAGAAMGLETMPTALLAILIAIVAHKAFAAMALGISLVDSRVPLARIVWTVVAFSLMTPLGLFVGTVFSEVLESDPANLAEGTFDALAAGTFLYIATLEMISGIFRTEIDRVRRFIFVSAGFTVMALLAVWA